MSVSVKDQEKIIQCLDDIYKISSSGEDIILATDIKDKLDHIFSKIDVACAGYTNLLTCLTCCCVDSSVDPRFHRQPKGDMPAPDDQRTWFSGRTISEKIIYPWMNQKQFRSAKSGWQTRTFERPKPYTLDYTENIAFIKNEFLAILDYVSRDTDESKKIIAYLLKKEIQFQQSKSQLSKQIAKNKLSNEVLIIDIIDALTEHFSIPNSSNLPVIAVYSIYEILISEFSSYSKLSLRDLKSHQASDLRTGAVGDIELEDTEGDVIEGVEVKHGMEVDLAIILTAREKIYKSNLKRYYILTTHQRCILDDSAILNIIREVYNDHGCQIIVNGVLPSIKYYLRLCSSPSLFINKYSENLLINNVTSDQLTCWQKIQEKLT